MYHISFRSYYMTATILIYDVLYRKFYDYDFYEIIFREWIWIWMRQKLWTVKDFIPAKIFILHVMKDKSGRTNNDYEKLNQSLAKTNVFESQCSNLFTFQFHTIWFLSLNLKRVPSEHSKLLSAKSQLKSLNAPETQLKAWYSSEQYLWWSM